MKRPTFISILAFFQFLGGIGLFLLLITSDMTPLASILNISNVNMFIPISILGVMSLGAAIGMWKGKRWGWYLGAIVFCYAIFRNGYALSQVIGMSNIIETSGESTDSYFIKYVGRVIINGLVLLYFFKANVIEYFQVTNLRDWKKVGIVVGVTIIIFLGFYGPGLFQSGNTSLTAITIAYNSGEIEVAKSQIENYLEKNPSDKEAWVLKGDILYDLGEVDESKESFLIAVSLDPNDVYSLTAIGFIYRQEGNFEKAMEYYLKVVELKPDYAVVYSNMAIVELQLNNDRKALEYAEKAYSLDNTQAVFAANLAVCHYKLGNFDEMDKYLKLAEEMGYHSIETIKEICGR